MTQSKTARSAQKGYTLVEVIMVIAILALVARIAFPIYTAYTTRSKITEGLSISRKARMFIDEAVALNFNGDTLNATTLDTWAGRFGTQGGNINTNIYLESVNLCSSSSSTSNLGCGSEGGNQAAGDIRIRYNSTTLPLTDATRTLYLVPFVRTSSGTEQLLDAMTAGRSAIGPVIWVCLGASYNEALKTGTATNLSTWIGGAATLPAQFSPPNCR